MRVHLLLGVPALLASCVCCPRPPSEEPAPARPPVSAKPATPEPLPDVLAWWDFKDPAATGAKFRAHLPRADAAGDLTYRIVLRTQIARTEGLQRRFPEAHAVLDEAEAMLQPGLHVARARVRIERGRCFNTAKEPARAKPLFLEALESAKQGGDENLAVDAAHMLAIVETGEAALAWNVEAMRLAEASREPRARKWLGSLYNNLGWTYFEQRDYERALALQKKNWDWHVEQKMADGARIGKWSYAKTLRMLGRLDEALTLQRELLAEADSLPEPDGFTFEELAEILLAQGKPDEARPWFAKAYAALSKDPYLPKDEPQRLERIQRLGAPPVR